MHSRACPELAEGFPRYSSRRHLRFGGILDFISPLRRLADRAIKSGQVIPVKRLASPRGDYLLHTHGGICTLVFRVNSKTVFGKYYREWILTTFRKMCCLNPKFAARERVEFTFFVERRKNQFRCIRIRSIDEKHECANHVILFAPHAFVSQGQESPSVLPSPLVFPTISTDFTPTP